MRNNEERISANKLRQDQGPPPMPDQNMASFNLNFITPTELVDLPSKGKFYKSDHPLKNKSSVEIKQMTAKEEDILTNRSFLKKGIALEKLLESIIVDKSINPQDLLVADRNAIFVAARISGYGDSYSTHVVCPSCDKKVKNTFSLTEKAAEWEENNVEVDDEGCFTVTLPLSKWNVKCRALTGLDEKKLISATVNKTSEDFTLIDQLKMLIVSIQEVDDRSLIEKAIELMPALDSKFLRKSYEKIIPGLNLTDDFSCSSCGHEEVMEVPLTADFFWPK